MAGASAASTRLGSGGCGQSGDPPVPGTHTRGGAWDHTPRSRSEHSHTASWPRVRASPHGCSPIAYEARDDGSRNEPRLSCMTALGTLCITSRLLSIPFFIRVSDETLKRADARRSGEWCVFLGTAPGIHSAKFSESIQNPFRKMC